MTEGVASRGGAKPGDKTMLDAWYPAAEAAKANAGGTGADCLRAASEAAKTGAASTAEMQSGMGRSKKLGKRSLGHIDPGAESAAILLAAWVKAIKH